MLRLPPKCPCGSARAYPLEERFVTEMRTYVLDTSVLLSDPWACSRFAEHEVLSLIHI